MRNVPDSRENVSLVPGEVLQGPQKRQVDRRRREAGAHQEARDDEETADEASTRADSVSKAEGSKGVIEHDRVNDGAEGRARDSDGHGQCMTFLKIMGNHGDTWDVHDP
jgi:hypothetical protein